MHKYTVVYSARSTDDSRVRAPALARSTIDPAGPIPGASSASTSGQADGSGRRRQKAARVEHDTLGPGHSPAPTHAGQQEERFMPAPAPTVYIGGVAVNPIGLGTLALGVEYPEKDKKPSRADAQQIIKAFHARAQEQLPRATCFLDTADTYCSGQHDLHSVEQLIADVVEGPGGTHMNMVVATKGGMCRLSEKSSGWQTRRLSASNVENVIRESAEALGKTPLFLWQMHHTDSIDPATLGDIMHKLAALRQEGLVNNIGLCNATAEQITRCHGILKQKGGQGLASVQNEFSLYTRTAENAPKPGKLPSKTSKLQTVQRCKELGIPFIAYSPLGGLQVRQEKRALGADWPRLASLARQKRVSCHALALAYMRHKWPHMVLIVGTRSAEHAQDSQSALGVRFTRKQFEDIASMKKGKH